MTFEPGSSYFTTPEPGSNNFVPEEHCGLELPEQKFYDHSVSGALAEVDQSIQLIERTLINPV